MEKCEICKEPIETMAFKTTGVCGELHRKVRDGESNREQPVANK